MDNLKPYPTYQETVIPWLGKMPIHWQVQKLRNLLLEVSERNRPDLPLLSVIREKGVILRDITSRDENFNYIPDDLSNYKVVRSGQFAMNKMKAWQGSYGVSNYDGIVSPAYFVFDIHGVDSIYFHTSIRSKAYISFFNQASDGVRIGQWDLSKPRMREIPFLIPPIEEQAAIARYLDWANGRIRKLIHLRQKQIKLLEEHKQNIIQKAVTGQIDVRTGEPYPAYKDSGVEWLGQVPEHWDVLLNQRIFREKIRSHGGKPETQLSLSQVDGLIPTKDMKERSLQTSTYENWKVTVPGDLVLNRFKAHLGVFFASTLRGIVSFHYGVFAPRRKLNSKYFELLCHTNIYKTIYAGRSNGMTVGLQNLSNQNFYSVRSIVPSLQEQDYIVSFAEEATRKINGAIQYFRNSIKLLQEYRTHLIADIVTGKVDVRQAAAALPEIGLEELPEEWEEETEGDAEEEMLEEGQDAE